MGLCFWLLLENLPRDRIKNVEKGPEGGPKTWGPPKSSYRREFHTRLATSTSWQYPKDRKLGSWQKSIEFWLKDGLPKLQWEDTMNSDRNCKRKQYITLSDEEVKRIARLTTYQFGYASLVYDALPSAP